MVLLALVGMEFSILTSHKNSKKAIMQKRATVSSLKSLSLDKDGNGSQQPPKWGKAISTSSNLIQQKGPPAALGGPRLL
jgi:hypothetical protein